MSLKLKLDSIEGLEEAVASNYKQNEDGSYILDVEGIEDEYVPKFKRDLERQHRKNAELTASEREKRIAELENSLSEMKDAGHRKAGDVEALEKSWQEKLKKTQSEYESKFNSLNKIIEEKTLDAAIMKTLEGKVKAPELFFDLVKKNAKVEIADGNANIRVLDKEGNPTALSLDEYAKSAIFDNEKFADLVIGSNASGGGANGSNQRRSGGATKEMKRSAFNALSPASQAAHFEGGGVLVDD